MGILDDVIQATDVCIQISAEVTTTAKALMFILNWRTSKWLLDTMQTDFCKSNFVSFFPIFVIKIYVKKMNWPIVLLDSCEPIANVDLWPKLITGCCYPQVSHLLWLLWLYYC